MKASDKLQDIAEREGLKVIETTSEASGYPRALRYAVIGFDDFEHARRVAEANGCRIEEFKTRAGWQLWHRTGNRVFEAFETCAEDFGDDYMMFEREEAETLYKDYVLPVISEMEDIEEVAAYVDKWRAIISECKLLSDKEVVICNESSDYITTMDKEVMEFRHDGKTLAIGIICDDEEEEEDEEE